MLVCWGTWGPIHNKLLISYAWPSSCQASLTPLVFEKMGPFLFPCVMDTMSWGEQTFVVQHKVASNVWNPIVFSLRCGLMTLLKKLMLFTIHKGEYVVPFILNTLPVWPFKEFVDFMGPLIRLHWPQRIHEAHRGNPCIVWIL